MSGPSFENIDRWLFEYVEGNLTTEQEAQLEAFIEANPELELDLDSWEATKIRPTSYEFPNQENLYREEKRKRRLIPYFFVIGTFVTISVLWFNINSNSKSPSSKLTSQKVEKFKTNSTEKKILKQNSLAENSNLKPSEKKNNGVKAEMVSYSTNNSNLTSNESANMNMESHPVNYYTEEPSSFYLDNDSIDLALENSLKIDDSDMNKVELTIEADSNNISINNNQQQTNSQTDQSIKGNSTSSQVKKNDHSNQSSSIASKIEKTIDKLTKQKVGLKNTYDHQMNVPGISQLDANFSSAGDVSSTRFRSLSRAQWIGKNNQSFSNQLSLDWYSKSLKSGFGVQGNYQYYGNGVIQNWNAAFIYSPKILITKGLIVEPAVRFKMGSKILNSGKVAGISQVEIDRTNTIDFYSNGIMPIGKNQWYRDLGTSILFHTKWIYFGAQMDNLLRHQDNIYETNIANPRRAGYHYRINAGTDFVSKNGKTSFNPYLFYEKFEKLDETWVGFNFQHKFIAIGGAFSNQSNYVISGGLRFQTFAFTYHYDQTRSEILGSRVGSHQLGITFNTKVNRSSRRYIHLN